MTVQSVSSTISRTDFPFNAGNLKDANTKSAGAGTSGSAVLSSEKYSSERLLLQYTNKDGDTVSLSAQSIDYQKAILAANNSSSPDDWKKIIESIKDEYSKMKGQIVSALFGKDDTAQPGGAMSSGTVEDPKAFDETKAIPGLPDYWSADKTAQRIVDFATSFLSEFKGNGDEFVGMIKDAIEKGFSQAKDIFGDMPGPIDKLTAKTHALVMDKIDKWAHDQGVGSANSADQQVSSAAV
jgi:hypothetical protein